ncbi:MAG: sulfotransferase [Pseudomonadota bacterium]|nr:sulfotransferase [Pseudomonadota bacterium]
MRTELRRIRSQAHELINAGRSSQAIDLIAAATRQSSRATELHALWSTLLLRDGRRADATEVIEAAATLPCEDADDCDGLAYVAMALGREALSLELYRRSVELAPNEPRLWFNLASAHRAMGSVDGAEAACNRAIALDRTFFRAYLLRSELRVQAPDANHIEELLTIMRACQGNTPALVILSHALAKEYDDLQRYDEAFAWLERGANARRKNLNYDVRSDTAKLKRIAEVYAETQPAVAATQDLPQFGFVVGLPRSGTTLVERILTGLPGVRSNGETDNFMRALLGATPPGPDDIFSRASRSPPSQVGASYARLATREGDATIIEKLPLNYLYLGAIARALPNARLLALRRCPLDSCFAMYRTLFAEGYPFSYHFDDLAQYYAAWDNLMKHWERSLGDRLHIVRYEELVREPQRIGAALAAHCGIEWQPETLLIANNPAASRTASASQIRRPIYSTSVGYWQRYRHHLYPLVEALRRNGIEVTLDSAALP